MGRAEAATGPAGGAEEANVFGGWFESHKGSHEEALGGLPQSPQSRGVRPAPQPGAFAHPEDVIAVGGASIVSRFA